MTAPGVRSSTRQETVTAHEQAVHLIDLEAVRKALLGVPVVLTELEAGAVVALCDLGGLDYTITAQGLGISYAAFKDRIKTRRRRVGGLTRDLQAAVMLRPAADLVAAVASGDADRVASVLSPLGLQQFAALAVVLAAAVSDGSILAGIPTTDDAGV